MCILYYIELFLYSRFGYSQSYKFRKKALEVLYIFHLKSRIRWIFAKNFSLLSILYYKQFSRAKHLKWKFTLTWKEYSASNRNFSSNGRKKFQITYLRIVSYKKLAAALLFNVKNINRTVILFENTPNAFHVGCTTCC